jgi:hypothetical protein
MMPRRQSATRLGITLRQRQEDVGLPRWKTKRVPSITAVLERRPAALAGTVQQLPKKDY